MEKPSKSQLKKLEKQRKAAERKREKEAARDAALAAEAEEKLRLAKERLEEAKNMSLEPDASLLQATRICVCDALAHAGQRIEVAGWVQFLRKQGSLFFLGIRDGSGSVDDALLQTVLSGPLTKTYDALTLYREASVRVMGTLKRDDRAPGGVELVADYWYTVGPSTEALENRFNAESKPDVLLDNRHLHLRSVHMQRVFKLRSIALQSFRSFFMGRDVYEVTPPTMVQTQVEGGSDLFKFDYFGSEAYLTQSSQLYLETVVPALGNVFCIMPSFRAEKSRTRRHVAEFSHIEAELGFIAFDDLLDFIEDMVVTVAETLDAKAGDFVRAVNPDFVVPQRPFLRMTYREAVAWLNKEGIDKELDDGTRRPYAFPDDIPELPERRMTDTIGRPIFLTKFPASQKPFYMSRPGDDDTVTESVDLLMPGVGEIVGGSMREHDATKLAAGYKAHGLDGSSYYWYNEMRDFGSCPHGGFGLGFERFLCWILKQSHINDVTLYPRFCGRCHP